MSASGEGRQTEQGAFMCLETSKQSKQLESGHREVYQNLQLDRACVRREIKVSQQ